MAVVNETSLLSVIVSMPTITTASRGQLPADADAAIRELYSRHAKALHGYVERFCPNRASADDIVQETLIRAWRHLPQLTADDRPVRPWLFRVARNLLTDADRAALVETFYHDRTLATVARRLGIPDGTARSRLHYALHALRKQIQEREAVAC